MRVIPGQGSAPGWWRHNHYRQFFPANCNRNPAFRGRFPGLLNFSLKNGRTPETWQAVLFTPR